MTFEKQCFVGLEDIKAVRFTCSDCGTAVLVPIKELAEGTTDVGLHVVRTCQCGAQSMFAEGTLETENLIRFNKLLAGLPATFKGRNIQYALQIEYSE